MTNAHVLLSSTRRQMIVRTGMAVGILAIGRNALAKPHAQATKEPPGTAANGSRTSLHQEVDFKASPQRIYEVLLDSKQFAAFTGMPAEIDSKTGGAVSMFGGMIVGRNLELISGQRIVQAWRSSGWASGHYSVVRFELKPKATGSVVALDHTGFPEGEFDHLDPGWKLRYWDPLTKFLA